jgi:ABC-type transporter Mla subunit MlaD
MKENRINATIAILSLIAAVVMLGSLSFAIGKWNFGNSGYQIIIRFPNATGINPNSAVKLAGANAGTVREVRLVPRADETVDPVTNQVNCVEVVAEIDTPVEIGDDVEATIKQDGIGIAAKYILLTPGPDRNSKALAQGSVVQGRMPFDLSDLVQPAGEALMQAKNLITELQPVLTRLDSLSQKMETSLPPLMDHGDKFLQDGDSVLANFNSPEGRARLNAMLDSLRVSTENLKVVSSNAKALTETLAEKPWRVLWGGSTVKPPPEEAVLKSNQVIPLKAQVEVNGDSSSSESGSGAKKQ